MRFALSLLRHRRQYRPRLEDQLIIPEVLNPKRTMCDTLFSIRDGKNRYWLPPVRCGVTREMCNVRHMLGS